MTDTLFVVTGLERSGTIWLTRLLADALQLPSQTRPHNPPFTFADDPAVWGENREGKFIRRLHEWPSTLDLAGVSRTYELPYIVIVRDPRDTAISQAHFYNHDPNARARWLAGGETSNWQRFYLGWLRDDRCLTHIRYEDLLANTRQELIKLLGNLYIDEIADYPPEDQIKAAIEANSFANMDNPLKRIGKARNWEGILTPDTLAEIDRASGEGMRRFGYSK